MKWMLNQLRLMLFALLVAPLLAIGCIPQSEAATVDQVVASGSVVLLALDTVEAERLRAIAHPTDKDILDARERVACLRAARDALDALDESKDLSGHKAKLALAVKLLRVAYDRAIVEKARLPPEAERALRFVESWLASQEPDGG